MVDLTGFKIASNIVASEDDIYLLSYANNKVSKNKRVNLNVHASRKFRELGVKRVQLLISEDEKTIVVVPDETGVSTRESKFGTNIGFGSKYVCNLFTKIGGKSGVKFIGSYDKDIKGFVFPLKDPILF